MPDFDRFRSFAERYVVGRAASFRTGHEREDAWAATLDAKTIYGNIARAAVDAEPDAPTQQAGGTIGVSAPTLRPRTHNPYVNAPNKPTLTPLAPVAQSTLTGIVNRIIKGGPR